MNENTLAERACSIFLYVMNNTGMLRNFLRLVHGRMNTGSS